jgi:hypothetical protein
MLHIILELLAVLTASAALTWLVRHYVAVDVLIEQNEALQVYINVVAALYGILVALVFVGQVSNHDATSALLARESTDMLFLFRIGQSLPDQADRIKLENAVREGTNYIIHDEWPQMVKQDIQHVIIHYPKLDRIWQTLMSFDVKDAKTHLLVEQAIVRFQQVLDARRTRLLHAEDKLPPIMWLILGVGGTFCVGHLYFIGMRKLSAHVALSAMSAGLVYLMLFLIFEYQNPFQGSFAVQPEPYTLALERMDEYLHSPE